MYPISAEGYKNAGFDLLREKKTGEIWAKMKNVEDGLAVQNISDLVLKEISGIYRTENLTKQQIKKYKITEKEIFKKKDKFSEYELNTKTKKEVYAKNDVMTTVIKHCRGEKSR